MVSKQTEQKIEHELDSARDYANEAKEYAIGQKIRVEGMVKEHPWAFVLGSFAGGVIIGTLLARRQ